MASDVVQFRHDEAALERLRAAGINPNEFARDAFEEKLRTFTIAQKMAYIEAAATRIQARRKARGDTTTFEELWIDAKRERDERPKTRR